MRHPLISAAAAAAAVLCAGLAHAAELVYVFEPGCPHCRLWDREIAHVYPKTAEARQAALLALDRRDPALAEIKLAGPVRYTPTFALVNDTAWSWDGSRAIRARVSSGAGSTACSNACRGRRQRQRTEP